MYDDIPNDVIETDEDTKGDKADTESQDHNPSNPTPPCSNVVCQYNEIIAFQNGLEVIN